MPIRAVEHAFTGASGTTYDATRTTLGSLIRQRTGATNEEKFAGPMPIALARPMEGVGIAVPCQYPHVISYSADVDWVFFADGATAAATRRIVWYEFTKSLGVWTYKGFITLTYPAATNHTVRGFRMTRDLYTTGTVSVSGTAVTGTGTTWTTDRLAAGARIGFGSTNPENITTWYNVNTITSNTAIVLDVAAGTIAAGSAYVIDELRAVTATTNATLTNGGLFVTKGLRPELFTVAGTVIAAATTVDNIRAVYWLADAATSLNTVAEGSGLEPRADWQTQFCYVLDGATSTRVFKYNIRAALTLTAGKATTAFVLSTAAQTITGTASAANNGRVGSLAHAAAGQLSLYWVTTTRVYRTPLTNITNGNANWVGDQMNEIPPGSVNTHSAGNAMNAIEIADSIDRLVILPSGASATRGYVTKFNTAGDQFDHIFLVDTRQTDQSTADPGAPAHPSVLGSAFTAWAAGGYLYLARFGTTASLNQIYALPLGAHWTYAGGTAGGSIGQKLITPKLATPGAVKLVRAYVNELQQLGTLTLGLPTEPFRVYARTAGIDDNSGAWTLLDATANLSGMAPGAHIQFAFEFKTIGAASIPARVHSVAVLYEDTDFLPSQFEWNVDDFVAADGTVGWVQIALFGGAVPTLKIDYFRSDTNANVLSQTSATTTNGVFEYWNGSAWVAGLGPDTLNTRRRFRVTGSLPAGVSHYVKLSTV